MSDLFISYSRVDQVFVRRLHEALAAHGREAWVDWEGIPPSAKWLDELKAAIEAAGAFVFVVSPDSVGSEICRQELEHAGASGKRIVPLLYREPPRESLPDLVAAHNWIEVRDGDDFDDALARLIAALDTDLDWVHEHTRLLTRATEWERAGHDTSFTLRGRDLDAAERRLGSGTELRNPRPTPHMVEYVIASRRAATRGQRIRAGALGVALVIALGLTGFAFLQLNEAVAQRSRAESQTRIATGRELAQASANQLKIDPELSLLLAIKGVETSSSLETDQALRAALQESRVRSSFSVGHGVTAAAIGADGRRLLVVADNGTVEVWEGTAGKLVRQLVPPGGIVQAVALTRDGGRALTAGNDGNLRLWDVGQSGPAHEIPTGHPDITSIGFDPHGTVALVTGAGGWTETWDLATGARIRAFDSGTDRPIYSGAFSLDGGRIAVSSEDSRIRIFDTATGELVRTLEGQKGPILAVAWSLDGALLATGCVDGTARVWDVATGDTVADTLAS